MSRLSLFASTAFALTAAAAVVGGAPRPPRGPVDRLELRRADAPPPVAHFPPAPIVAPVTEIEEDGAPLRVEVRLGHRCVPPGSSEVDLLLEVTAPSRASGPVARNLVVAFEPATEGVQLVDVFPSTLGDLEAGATARVVARLRIATKAAPDLMRLTEVRVTYVDVEAGKPRATELNVGIGVTSIPQLVAKEVDAEVEARVLELRRAKGALVRVDPNVDYE